MIMWYFCFGLLLSAFIQANEGYFFLPFTVKEKGKTFEERLKTKLETEVCYGTPYQCNMFNLDTSTYLSWVLNISTPNLELHKPFNSSASSTFEFDGFEFSYWRQAIKKGFVSNDKLKLGSFEFKSSMIIPKEIHSLDNYGVIGLQNKANSPTLISQLKAQKLINHNEFSFEYTSPTKGVVSFGRTPINSTYLFEANVSKSDLHSAYVLLSNNIFLGPNMLKSLGGIINIDASFGFIEAPIRAKETIETAYSLKDSQCFENQFEIDKGSPTRERIYYYYLCENSFLDKAKPAYHDFFSQFNHNVSNNVSLTKEELFTDFNSTHKLFIIVVKEGDTQNYDWVFGEPILKKYKTVYSIDDSKITFYTRDNYSELSSKLIMIFCMVFLPGVITMGVIIGLRIANNRKRRNNNRESSLISKEMDYESNSKSDTELKETQDNSVL